MPESFSFLFIFQRELFSHLPTHSPYKSSCHPCQLTSSHQKTAPMKSNRKMRTVVSILFFLIVTSSGDPLYVKSKSSVNINQRKFIGDVVLGARHTVNSDSWFCGSTRLHWDLSHSFVSFTCDEKMSELNYCCAVHDSCYDTLNGGRENCDRHFCQCLNKTMSQPELPFTCLNAFSSLACKAVENFGGRVYGERHSDVMILLSYHPALNQTAYIAYNRLYAACPFYRKPLISCAYNHMLCTLKMLPAKRYSQEYPDCRDKLLTCIEETSEFLNMRQTEKCSKQLDKALEAIKDDARLSGLPEEYHYIEGLTTLGLSPDDITTSSEIGSTSEEVQETTENLSDIYIGETFEDKH